MALEPITRQEKIIAGQDLTPITRMEMFLKNFGGGGSVPKPLTYDYMPEGYPKKSAQTTTLMEEQELAFAHVANGIYGAFMDTALDIVVGKTYTVNWDGTEYQCVCVDDGKGNRLIGNTYIMGNGIDTGEPFLYDFFHKAFATNETSASHTISVKTTEEVVTPMASEFLPVGAGQFVVVVYNENPSGTILRSDKTYDEISAAIESGMGVVIHYKQTPVTADYTVLYHTRTEAGYYQFCNLDIAAGVPDATFIGIYEENGEMVIERKTASLQTVT